MCSLFTLSAAAREKSLSLVFDTILSQPDQLGQESIRIFIRGVMLPLYDDIVHMDRLDFSTSLIFEISDRFSRVVGSEKFYPYLREIVSEIMTLNSVLISAGNISEKYSSVAIASTKTIFLSNLVLIGDDEPQLGWGKFCESLSRFVISSIPQQLMVTEYNDLTSLPFDPVEVMNVCVTHLGVLGLVSEVVDVVDQHPGLTGGSLFSLVESIERSHSFALRFNLEQGLREKLKKLGFMNNLRQLPKLVKQEILSIGILIRILALCHENEKLKSTITALVDSYVERDRMLHSVSVQVQDHVHEEIEGSISGVNGLIAGTIFGSVIGKMSTSDFDRNKTWIFDLAIKLVTSNDISVRKAVADCLAKRFRP
jgi:hypothetical protein